MGPQVTLLDKAFTLFVDSCIFLQALSLSLSLSLSLRMRWRLWSVCEGIVSVSACFCLLFFSFLCFPVSFFSSFDCLI